MTRGTKSINYAEIATRVESLVSKPISKFSDCVDALMMSISQDFPGLTVTGNPIFGQMKELSRDDLLRVIREYSVFSNAALHMFLEARVRNHWPALTKEIVRNMDEEMGQLTRGVPHLELMRHGYRVELGIETEDVVPSASTKDFIRRMNALFRVPDNEFLGGVLLAFEAVAVEEFRLVERLLRRYGELVHVGITADQLTGLYIAGHVVAEGSAGAADPELDHYKGMADAIASSVGNSDLERLRRGFLSVCLELSRWWDQLLVDTLCDRARHRLEIMCDESRRRYEHMLAS